MGGDKQRSNDNHHEQAGKRHSPRILSISAELIRGLEPHRKRCQNPQHIHTLQKLLLSPQSGRQKTAESKAATHKVHNLQTLESHKRRPQNQKQPIRSEASRTQKHSKHTDLHRLEKALFNSTNQDEFTVRAATNIGEACKLVQAGFEYVTGDYNDGGKIFRKHK